LFSRQNGRYTTPEAAACGCYGTPRHLSATHYFQPTYQRPTKVWKRSQSTSFIEKVKAASRETRQFFIYDQFKVELRKDKNPIERSVVVYGNNIPGT